MKGDIRLLGAVRGSSQRSEGLTYSLVLSTAPSQAVRRGVRGPRPGPAGGGRSRRATWGESRQKWGHSEHLTEQTIQPLVQHRGNSLNAVFLVRKNT